MPAAKGPSLVPRRRSESTPLVEKYRALSSVSVRFSKARGSVARLVSLG